MTAEEKLIFRAHALGRMFERRISADDVRNVLKSGSTIEEYPDDTPYPSRLVLGRAGGRPIHVVAARNDARCETIVVTVYEPDPDQWDAEYRRRKP